MAVAIAGGKRRQRAQDPTEGALQRGRRHPRGLGNETVELLPSVPLGLENPISALPMAIVASAGVAAAMLSSHLSRSSRVSNKPSPSIGAADAKSGGHADSHSNVVAICGQNHRCCFVLAMSWPRL